MELSLSGSALKTFARSVTCLARVGTELVLQAAPSQLSFHTINSSRSAYQSITLKPDFFDAYTVSASQAQCSVLLKAVCAILRTPVASVDNLCVKLPNSDAAKVEWTLHCNNGMKKTYWISCNVEPDIQHLSLDKTKFPSNFVVGPINFNRLLANFQSSLQEITIIATEPSTLPSDAAGVVGGKAVEIRSYIDPTKDNSDVTLHTQLWIDPSEEFIHYKHNGDPVDVTFSVKELKLHEDNSSEPQPAGPMPAGEQNQEPQPAGPIPDGQKVHSPSSHPLQASDHKRIWSELSGSVARSSGGVDDRHAPRQVSPNSRGRNNAQMLQRMVISENPAARENASRLTQQARKEAGNLGFQDQGELRDKSYSQHHPSNWMNAADEEDDEEDEDLCVHTTPPY